MERAKKYVFLYKYKYIQIFNIFAAVVHKIYFCG